MFEIASHAEIHTSLRWAEEKKKKFREGHFSDRQWHSTKHKLFSWISLDDLAAGLSPNISAICNSLGQSQTGYCHSGNIHQLLITSILAFKHIVIRKLCDRYTGRKTVKVGFSLVLLSLMSWGVLHSQSCLSSLMGSNDTCRTLRNYTEPQAAELKGADNRIATDQSLFHGK